MKKLVALLFIFPFCLTSVAQNVGIGNPSPAEKLDVTGNINVTGTIKANGVDGTPNQVLMKNNSGTLAWGDICDYKNMATFSNSSGSWAVPAGVTKVWVELWGAGGGGNVYAGGGGGAYISAIFEVTPSSLVYYSSGAGGAGATLNAVAGAYSNISYPTASINLVAYGGQAALFSNPYYLQGSSGGSFSISSGFTSYIGIPGNSGRSSVATTLQSSATNFYEVISDGVGGDAGNTTATGGLGAYVTINLNPVSVTRLKFAKPGNLPGGGGGAGYFGTTTSGAGSAGGESGGNGMVIIHY